MKRVKITSGIFAGRTGVLLHKGTLPCNTAKYMIRLDGQHFTFGFPRNQFQYQ